MSKVSVIVPVYNVEKYLNKCLDSLVNQTLKDIEIIIVNDGSPDNSKKIIKEYKKKYPSIIKVLDQTNQGLSDARNNALSLTTSKYIMYVDSDDYVANDMVEKMYNKIVKDKADMVICGNNVVDENYNLVSSTYPSNNNYSNDFEKIIFGNMCVWNKIIKKSLIVDNNLKFRSKVWYEDVDFSFKLMTLSKKTTFVNENLYYYLVRKNSIMNSKNVLRNREILLTFEEIITYLKDHELFEKYYSELEYLAIDNIYISAIVRIIKADSDKKTKKIIIKEMLDFVKNNFPCYKKNKYIKDLSKNRKIIFFLIDKKLYGIVNLMFKIKEI